MPDDVWTAEAAWSALPAASMTETVRAATGRSRARRLRSISAERWEGMEMQRRRRADVLDPIADASCDDTLRAAVAAETGRLVPCAGRWPLHPELAADTGQDAGSDPVEASCGISRAVIDNFAFPFQKGRTTNARIEGMMHILAFAVSLVLTLAVFLVVAIATGGASWSVLLFAGLAAVVLQAGYLATAYVLFGRRRAGSASPDDLDPAADAAGGRPYETSPPADRR